MSGEEANVVGGVAGGAIGMITTLANNALSKKYADAARKENYLYGEMAAENAKLRQWETIEKYYTPKAQLQMIRDAGLSPSLMYENSGSVGTTTAPQGGGSGNVGNSFVPFNAVEAASMANMMAEARLKNAQADTIEGKNERGKSEIDNLIQDTAKKAAETGNTEEQTEMLKLQEDWQDVQNFIANHTEEYQIRIIEKQLEMISKNVEEKAIDIAIKTTEKDFQNASYQERLQAIKNDNALKAQQILESKAKVKLTDEQRKLVKQDIENYATKLQQEWERIASMKDANEAKREWNKVYQKVSKAQIENAWYMQSRDLKYKYSELQQKKIQMYMQTIYQQEKIGIELLNAITPW